MVNVTEEITLLLRVYKAIRSRFGYDLAESFVRIGMIAAFGREALVGGCCKLEASFR